jgi:phosphate transport system permease protein
VPLFAGTFLIMAIAMAVAAPIGLFSAVYLSEYSGKKTRALVKPALEVLAGVPTVVYGFFAALTVGPALRVFFNGIGDMLIGGPLNGLGIYLSLVQNQMALTAGAVMGIMLIPFVSSLSDDILNAVPQSLRDGSYAMGATKSETVKEVSSAKSTSKSCTQNPHANRFGFQYSASPRSSGRCEITCLTPMMRAI